MLWRPGSRVHDRGGRGLSSSIGFRGVGLAVAFLSIAGAASLRADEIGAARAPAVRLAQSGLPPADIPGAADEGAGDPAGLLVKIERLESQLRMANGQIEELQNQQRQLEDQLKRFREDMEFRLGQLSGAQPPTGAQPPAAVSTPQPTKPKKPPASDAFDPSTAAPNAPGAPLQLGKTSPSPPLAGRRVTTRAIRPAQAAALTMTSRGIGRASVRRPTPHEARAPTA